MSRLRKSVFLSSKYNKLVSKKNGREFKHNKTLTRRLSESDEGVLLRLLGYIVARFCINRKLKYFNDLSIDTNIRVSRFLLLK
jgi:hypothetical protein